jgi:hypothetical protein
MAVFRSAIPGYQGFTKKGTRVRFIGGKLETEITDIIEFLRNGIRTNSFKYQGRSGFITEQGGPVKEASAATEPPVANDAAAHAQAEADPEKKSKRETQADKHEPPYAKKRGDPVTSSK